jgi:hypothetical protein
MEMWQIQKMEKLEKKFERTSEGWLWKGAPADNGYGRYNGRSAHLVMYEVYVGPIPEGYVIDHVKGLCIAYGTLDVKVVADEYGPAHLQMVTTGENHRRYSKDFCKNGHDTRIVGRNRYGYCMQCQRDRANSPAALRN